MTEREGELLLSDLYKFGGIGALALGVLYLFLSRLVRHGVIPRLKEWQAFVFICLVVTFAFVIALLALHGDGQTGQGAPEFVATGETKEHNMPKRPPRR